MPKRDAERIMVIRLGALGDLTLCFRAFQSIRSAHKDARIAILTQPAFAGFAGSMPWFDEVLADTRPPAWRIGEWRRLIARARKFAPTRVYDLQGKPRQSFLYMALGGALAGPEWSGAAPFCSHPRPWPPQEGMHYTDFVAAQLLSAGVEQVAESAVEKDWLSESVEEFLLPEKYALLIPGCAPNRSYKRWHPAKYAALADRLKEKGVACVAIGTGHDTAAIREITALSENVADLSGRTTLKQVAELARRAVAVIGNDTGPTHLAAAAGGRVIALMSEKVNPVWSAPKGSDARWIQGRPLRDLAVEEAWTAVSCWV